MSFLLYDIGTRERLAPLSGESILGGSSAINASFYSRADLVFYQKSGVNWDLRVVTESYKRVEKAVVFRPELGN